MNRATKAQSRSPRLTDCLTEIELVETDSTKEVDSCLIPKQNAMNLTGLSSQQQRSLDAILKRLRPLIVERIGHIWDIEYLPDIAGLYAIGETSGQQPFPYGCFYWRIEDADGEMKMFYGDFVRVVSGWGRAYEITPTETRLTDEGLD